jgi:RNA polymerase sigma-70 factor (ECF subfamily)
MPGSVTSLVDDLFRREYGKMVAILSSAFGFGNLDIAHDIVQETLAAAFQHWSYGSVPDRPEAWLMRVAKNKALNYVKHEHRKARIHKGIGDELKDASNAAAQIETVFDGEIDDAVLRMIFACCHPDISPENQIALILKTLGGFGTSEIARALLVTDDTISKRLYRAKQTIRAQGIHLEAPGGAGLDERVGVVCKTLYLLYNEGYNATRAETAIRRDLCFEAMRLCKLLTARFPERTDVFALAALMCFHTARFDARVDRHGALVIFADQDRSLWDRALIDRGLFYLTESARGDELTPYHLQASIAAQHCLAPSFEDTNWQFVYTLYERLYELEPNPIIKLNLAIVESQRSGLDRGIELLEQLRGENKLTRYSLLYATLGELYRQRSQHDEAVSNFVEALRWTQAPHEEAFLQAKLALLRKKS